MGFTSEQAREAGKKSKRKSARVVLQTHDNLDDLLDDVLSGKYSEKLRDEVIRLLVSDAISERAERRKLSAAEQLVVARAYCATLNRDELEGLLDEESDEEKRD